MRAAAGDSWSPAAALPGRPGMKHKSPLVRIDEVQSHIQQMLSQGATINAISRASGVHKSTVSGLNRGVHAFVDRDTARKILAIDGAPNNKPVMCSAIGAARRIRALAAIGYSHLAIAREANVSVVYLQKIHSHHKDQISAQMHAEIAAAYERLHKIPGPSNHVRSLAAGNSCLPPEAWEGVDIDDPRAQPWGIPVA